MLVQTAQSAVQPVSEVMSKINLDYTELAMLIIGALIGFALSIATIIVERLLDKHGNLHIFYKFTNQEEPFGPGWGFDRSQGDRVYFCIPLIIELQNTSNVTRVIRDLSLWIYNDNKKVVKMVQVERFHTTITEGNKITDEQEVRFGSDKGSYSFVLPPRSIQRQKCQFIFGTEQNKTDAFKFNTVKATFFNESGKQECYTVRSVNNCWELKHYDADKEWGTLNDKKKRSKL